MAIISTGPIGHSEARLSYKLIVLDSTGKIVKFSAIIAIVG